MDSLIHPKKKLRSVEGHSRCAALVTAVAVIGDSSRPFEAADSANLLTVFQDMMSDLRTACSLCDEILSMEFAGGVVVDRCESLVALIRKHRVISLCILKWLSYTVSDNAFVSSPSYALLCPMLLQFIVVSTELYPSHHPECFSILELMNSHKAKFEDSDSGRTMEIVSVKRDIMDSVIYLISEGYTAKPLNFLAVEVGVSDAAIARHVVLSFLESFSPPFESSFANSVLEIVLSASSRKALSSKYFEEKDGPKLLQVFCNNISKVANIDESKLADLRSSCCC